MRERRLCPGCWADWIEVDANLCLMCFHERQRQRPRGSLHKNKIPVAWWGPEPADLVKDPSEQPLELPWGYHMVEQEYDPEGFDG